MKKVVNKDKRVITNNQTESKFFVINKNVPIQPKRNKKGMFRSIIEKLEPGDSFVVPDFPKTLYSIKRTIGMDLICRKNNDGNYTIWRKS